MNGKVVLNYTCIIQSAWRFMYLMIRSHWTGVFDNLGQCRWLVKGPLSWSHYLVYFVSCQCFIKSTLDSYSSYWKKFSFTIQILFMDKSVVTAVMCSVFLVLVRTLATGFIMIWSWLIRQKVIMVVKSAGGEGWIHFCKSAVDIKSLYLFKITQTWPLRFWYDRLEFGSE